MIETLLPKACVEIIQDKTQAKETYKYRMMELYFLFI